MGFRRLFWGILFLFSFRINGFDILPDVIGYLLILAGLSGMASRSFYFASARNLSFVAVVLSVFTIFQSPQPGMLGSTLNLILLIINAILFYQICNGINECAQRQGDWQLAKTAMNRWSWYLRILIFNFLIWIIGFILPALAIAIFPILLVVLMVAMFVIYALMMGLMSQAERSLG